MNALGAMLYVEALKARRSRALWILTLAFLVLPLALGLLMYVAMHPNFAREIGLLRAKADLAIGKADWQTFLGFIAQGVSAGGLLLFSLASAWLFGRESVDGTLKDLLATPTSRSVVVAAKFITWALLCGFSTVVMFLGGLVVGRLLGLPGGDARVIGAWAARVGGVATLIVLTLTPIAWFASVGKGYLAPVGAAFAFVASSQVAAVLGWGTYFPWAIPALYSGYRTGAELSAGSYLVVALTALIGFLATDWWWKRADHH